MADGQPIRIAAPLEALRYFRDKGFTFSFAWQDMWREEHARAFTVAKAMTRDVLETIREAVDAAIADGTTLETFQKELTPKLQALGWWGGKTMIDPLTAQAKTVQLGSPTRLKTIYNVNTRTAYQVGRWERIERQKQAFPYLRYVSVRDGREREQHRAWHNTIRPVDDPWWDTHYPPCGWNCRCTAVAYNARQLERKGWTVTKDPASFPSRDWTNKRTGQVHRIEDGIDPGWNYNVGKAPLAGITPPPLPSDFRGAIGADTRIALGLGPFFERFGISSNGPGRVFTDREGWPLAISEALFQQDGRYELPSPERLRFLPQVARAIINPGRIRWVWLRASNGSTMLVRRYLSAEALVDFGRSGWRFAIRDEVNLALLDQGKADWPAS